MNNRILVVDDDVSITTYMKFILSKGGYDVSLAADGNLAWDSLCENKEFDLIISDVRMPNCDGFEFLDRVMKSEYRDVPFVIMTGYSERTEEEAKAHGAVFYLPKPFDIKTLRSMIKQFID